MHFGVQVLSVKLMNVAADASGPLETPYFPAIDTQGEIPWCSLPFAVAISCLLSLYFWRYVIPYGYCSVFFCVRVPSV